MAERIGLLARLPFSLRLTRVWRGRSFTLLDIDRRNTMLVVLRKEGASRVGLGFVDFIWREIGGVLGTGGRGAHLDDFMEQECCLMYQSLR
jgi:hypothetical protein